MLSIGSSPGLLNVSQALVVNNALSEFYYTSFYHSLLAASFFIGEFPR